MANTLAAGTAVFFCCAEPQKGEGKYFVIRHRGITAGRLEVREAGQRRDASGPFVVTECRLHLRRWADSRGVVNDELALVAARRPARYAYYFAGRWNGGEFRYRRGSSWYYKLVDEFGNVTETRGRRAPSFLTFRGAPLPIATARRRSNPAILTSLELTSGRVSPYRGRGDPNSWTGLADGHYVRVAFAADGGVVSYADAAGVATSPANGPPRLRGFLYKNPELLYLPFIIPPASKAARLRLPLTARLSRRLRSEDLTGAGQYFSGRVTGNVVTGTFTLEPAGQPYLENARPGLGPARAGPWPHLQGEGELERLAAYYRARGKSVRVITGLGLFGGNLLAPYDWLEVEGRGVAAPGRPVPQLRVALAKSSETLTLAKFALAGDAAAEGRGVQPIAPAVPGLTRAAELVYAIFHRGAPAGEITALYEAAPKKPPAVLLMGDVFGQPVATATSGLWLGAGSPRPARAAPSPLREAIALGAAVAVPDEGAKPPHEFYFPAGAGRPGRAEWRGLKAVVVGGESCTCRVYEIEPGPCRAYYTNDGVLTRLEYRDFVARLTSFPPRARARTFAAPRTGGEGESE